MFLDPPLVELLERLDRQGHAETLPPEAALPPGATGVSRPHPGADPDRAARLSCEYHHALAAWQALPFWRRMITKKPEPPQGI